MVWGFRISNQWKRVMDNILDENMDITKLKVIRLFAYAAYFTEIFKFL